MAKISTLPPAGPLTGDEALLVTQGGASKQMPLTTLLEELGEDTEVAADLADVKQKLSLTGEVGLPSNVTPVTGSALAAGWIVLAPVREDDYLYTAIWGFQFANRTYNLAAVDRDPVTGEISNPTNATSFTTTEGNAPFSSDIHILVPAGKLLAILNPSVSLSTAAGAGYDGGYYGPGASFPFTDTTAQVAHRVQLGVAFTYQVVTSEIAAAQVALDARLKQIEGAFTTSPPKNLFNPALCVDNHYHTNSNGAAASQALPGRIDLGAQAVEPGKTYVYSINDDVGFQADKRLICRNSRMLNLGYSSGAGGVAPNPPIVTVIDERTLKIEMPEATTTRFIGISTRDDLAHTTADFERIIASIQLEEGAVKTRLEPPSPDGFARLKPLHGPDAGYDETFPGTIKDARGWVERAGNNVYIRTWYDPAFDLVQRMALAGGTSTQAKVVNQGGARLVARDIKNTQGGFNVSTAIVAVQNDDAGPYNYSGTYIGANHGCDDLRWATVAGHGRTIPDVGSRWLDSLGYYWVLMEIVNANTLAFMSENLSAYPAWSFRTALSGTLTHVSGATNTANIVLGAVSGNQLLPAINSQAVSVAVDGSPVSTDFAMPFTRSVVIGESYNVSNPADMVAKAKANVGSATVPDYDALGVESDLAVNMSYAFAVNGALTLTTGGHTINPLVNFNEFTLTQAVGLTVTGTDTRHFHVPRAAPFSIGGNSYDLASGHNITSSLDTMVELYGPTWPAVVAGTVTSRWAEPSDPPNEMSYIIRDNAGALKHSFTMGFNEERGVGIPANRASQLGRAGYIKADQFKAYPAGIDRNGPDMPSTLPANYHFGGMVYRGWTLPDAPAPVFFWYPTSPDEREVFVVASWPDALTDDAASQILPLPDRFIGRKVTIVREDGGAVLHTRDMVLRRGLSASVTGGGEIVVKLT